MDIRRTARFTMNHKQSSPIAIVDQQPWQLGIVFGEATWIRARNSQCEKYRWVLTRMESELSCGDGWDRFGSVWIVWIVWVPTTILSISFRTELSQSPTKLSLITVQFANNNACTSIVQLDVESGHRSNAFRRLHKRKLNAIQLPKPGDSCWPHHDRWLFNEAFLAEMSLTLANV